MEFEFLQMHTPYDDTEQARFRRDGGCSGGGRRRHNATGRPSITSSGIFPSAGARVFLTWVAARKKQIHVGTAITNITAG
jgi:hypothetical protein